MPNYTVREIPAADYKALRIKAATEEISINKGILKAIKFYIREENHMEYTVNINDDQIIDGLSKEEAIEQAELYATNSMNDSEKIEVAKEFIALHKNPDVNDWNPIGQSDNKKFLEIFSNLEQGIYGNLEDDGMGNWMVEIGSHESKSGNPITFEWEK